MVEAVREIACEAREASCAAGTGVNHDARNRAADEFAPLFSRCARAYAESHGAPKSVKGVVVPRPSAAVVASRKTVAG